MGLFKSLSKQKDSKPQIEKEVNTIVNEDFKIFLIKSANARRVTKSQIEQLYDAGLIRGVSKEQVFSYFEDEESEQVIYDTVLGEFYVSPKNHGHYTKQEITDELNFAVRNTILDYGNNLKGCSKEEFMNYVQNQLKFSNIKHITTLSYHRAFANKKDNELSQLSILVGENHILTDEPISENKNESEIQPEK